MLSRRLFLVAGAAMLGVCALGLDAAAAHRGHGKTMGGLDLPSATADGHIRGVLKGRQGNARLELRGRLVPSARGEGAIEGRLFPAGAPAGTPPVAIVRGRYKHGPNGMGHLRLVIIREDPSGTNPPRRIGQIQARFKDDQPNGTPGRFAGRWRIR